MKNTGHLTQLVDLRPRTYFNSNYLHNNVLIFRGTHFKFKECHNITKRSCTSVSYCLFRLLYIRREMDIFIHVLFSWLSNVDVVVHKM